MHGSPKETHKIHGGKAMGSKELMVGAGGSNPFSVRAKGAAASFEGGSKTSGKVKGIKTYREE